MNALAKVGAFLGTVAFAVVASVAVHIKTEEAKVNPLTMLRNVVSVETPNGYCSGWVLQGTHKVITAAHCINGEIDTDPTVDFGDGIKHPFQPTKIGDMMYVTNPDVLVLETKDTTVKWPVGLPICPTAPYYGQEVVLYGGPLGWSQTLEFGHVGNPFLDLQRVIGYSDKFTSGFIEFDGKLLPGNSGGPGVDKYLGCVVGMAEGILPADHNGETGFPYGVNFLTPAHQIAEFVK